jgi:hypothetical protein
LLHFVVIGALLFAVTALREQRAEHSEIRITAGCTRRTCRRPTRSSAASGCGR